ncbi:hypothetical protein, partial [Citrobacter portucalensis]|uniref:hypothetical protein n=1 Tax=Citrobacter portucalensis TaxID=1639133 RepID=UPI0040412DF9
FPKFSCLGLLILDLKKGAVFHLHLLQIWPHSEPGEQPGLTHQCLYFEQPHTFEQILFIQTAEPALVGHAQIT